MASTDAASPADVSLSTLSAGFASADADADSGVGPDAGVPVAVLRGAEVRALALRAVAGRAVVFGGVFPGVAAFDPAGSELVACDAELLAADDRERGDLTGVDAESADSAGGGTAGDAEFERATGLRGDVVR